MISGTLLLLAAFGPFLGAALAQMLNDHARIGRAVTASAAISTAAAFGLLIATGLDSSGRIEAIGWADASIDRIGALLLVVVMGTATVVSGFSSRSLDDDGRTANYFALLGTVASGSALVLTQGPPLLLVIGWIIAGWALVGLIGFERSWPRASMAQRRILRTLLVGDVALISAVGIATVYSDGLLTGDATAAVTELHNSSFLGIEVLHVVMLLTVVAGASRSAMLPFHRWLIGTLTAPTPVSALVHAGLVSGAGLLFLRFAEPFVASDPAVIAAFALGVATVVIASAATWIRSDVKGSLAWSTVAQMAFMVVQCAVGAFSSAAFHIAGHGMYKAALFLGSGDTVAGGLRNNRRAAPVVSLSAGTRLGVSALVTTGLVALFGWLLTPDVSPAGRVLVFVFAWLTVASGINGWLKRGPLAPIPAILVGTFGALVGTITYLGGLRLAEAFVKPALEGVPSETVINQTVLLVVLGVVGLGVAAVALLPDPSGTSLRDAVRGRLVQLIDPLESGRSHRAPTTHDNSSTFASTGRPNGLQRGEIRADVARASDIISPQWPLASFVAVNPLGGLESLSFDEATRQARHWLGAKTHLDLEAFRRDYERGLSRLVDLRYVAHDRYTELSETTPVAIGGQALPAVEVIVADMLHSPPTTAPPRTTTPRAHTAVQRCEQRTAHITATINDTLSGLLAAWVNPPQWALHRPGESFVSMSLRSIATDPRLRFLVGSQAKAWLSTLDRDPASVIESAFNVSGVPPDDRVDEARGHLCHLSGWAGLAKWRNEWAHGNEQLPSLSPIDLVAVRAALEACALGSGVVAGPAQRRDALSPLEDDATSLDARVDAVLAAISPSGSDRDRSEIARVLSQVPAESLASMWLDAQERFVDARLLSMLDRLDPGKKVDRPDAQLVFCIDVRSEGFRQHLEEIANVETLGFAGFFGVPMSVSRLGWDHYEARCPVLVSPVIAATETAREDGIGEVASRMTRQRNVAGLLSAHSGAKYGPGAPFALAETAGWLLGPVAAARTFISKRSTPPRAQPTQMILDDDEVLLEQRTFFAESVLTTMGLTDRFAPLVVLCGHTSQTTNNAHATALECGACAGASGDDNARAVAALLNSLDVRHSLSQRGISIPDDTWFTAGIHDTASDRVQFLDGADVPETHRDAISRLEEKLELAGERQAAVRAAHLPGPDARVRERGADWAQVRPEWGLARNAAFIIGPRSMTAGLDLDGRAFLHSYNAADDPTGRVLETIMTAPLVVGHWISSQYYFSTVDPEAFGAGNKLLHNPIGTTGVISGDRGDLRVGLPLQSTHLDGKPFHQPVRLLAVIQADLQQIETIIANNPILRTLTRGSWLRIAARSQPDQRWSTRTPRGTWVETPRAFDPDPLLVPNTETS